MLNSKIILCQGINLDRNYTNVLNYTESEMLELCQSKSIVSAENFSFIRVTNTIRVPFSYEKCLQANYLAFQNPDYSNKWFFAWVDEVMYKSDASCEISFTIDSWSTWFGKWNAKSCFVVREHTNDDTIGANTVPENLDIGEVVAESSYDSLLYTTSYLIIECNFDPFTKKKFSGLRITNNIFSGVKRYAFLYSASSVEAVSAFIAKVVEEGGSSDWIENIYVSPAILISDLLVDYQFIYEETAYNCYILKGSTTVKEQEQNRPKLHSFSGINVKNNKCFSYPYNYLYVTNHNGNDNIYRYEDFSDTDNATFKIIGALTVGASMKLVPVNYKGADDCDEESIPLGKLPTISWSSDAFTNWLTQQAVNIPTQIASSVVSAVATGNAMSIASTTASVIGQFYSASLLPNVEQGSNTADVTFARGKNTFTFRQMHAKAEYIKIIDDYFSRFGYKINRVKKPNITGRQYFNYVEIGSDEIIGYGTVPTVYMNEINQACRKGVTIWHTHDRIGNFDLDNPII